MDTQTALYQMGIFETRTAAQVEHTDNCNRRHAAKLAYDAKYPNSCRKCQGMGFISWPATRMDPGDSEPCADCMDEGKCPRCGAQHDENWNMDETLTDVCTECGWDPQSGDCRPDDDCNCFETPGCSHSPDKLFTWWARDDTAPDGQHLCVACNCGAVLH